MSWFRLALANLGLSKLTSAVNVLLMALGTASIVLLLLVGTQLSETMSRDARGIDLVIGAKGSPVQLVLASVYHADAPPGNIRLADAKRWADDPRIESSVPLSLGDSYRSFRIVGTIPDYADIYDAELSGGRWWQESLEAVVGAAVAGAADLTVGSSFESAHGLAEGGHEHDDAPYRVVGVLEPTGTVIDRLILTSLDSVWDLHDEGGHDHDEHVDEHDHEGEEHDQDEHADEHDHEDEKHDHDEHADEHDHEGDEHDHDEHDEHADDPDLEITAMLLRYRSATAAAVMPRQINADGALQAASPAVEVSRVLQMIGIGLDGLRAFAWLLIVSAGLSIFAALYGSLRARRGDIAMLRCLGATRWELLFALMLEGFVLSVIGVTLGFAAGHLMVEILGGWLESARGVTFTGLIWLPAETALLAGLFAVGIVAAAIPAIQAYRTDVARTLAEAP